jgi:riboflavin synthase
VFTGIVQRIGVVEARLPRGGAAAIRIRHEPWGCAVERGESVAVAGVCLTVVAAGAGTFECDVLEETLAKTSLGRATARARVNLERALRAGDRIGGHFVTGHVDGTGEVVAVRPAGPDAVVEIRCAPSLLEGIVSKGSVACDGVSLTVAAVRDTSFEAHLAPLTRAETTLGALRPGDVVNIETDLIGKHVRRPPEPARRGLTLEDLHRAGLV